MLAWKDETIIGHSGNWDWNWDWKWDRKWIKLYEIIWKTLKNIIKQYMKQEKVLTKSPLVNCTVKGNSMTYGTLVRSISKMTSRSRTWRSARQSGACVSWLIMARKVRISARCIFPNAWSKHARRMKRMKTRAWMHHLYPIWVCITIENRLDFIHVFSFMQLPSTHSLCYTEPYAYGVSLNMTDHADGFCSQGDAERR